MMYRVLSVCRSRHGYPPDYEECNARFMSDGSVIGGCGDPCSFVMQKGGAGFPPFHYKRRKYVGGIPVPGSRWEDE
jgi:hypothetical protein